eukprot:TRINITY_DN41748_c0_g1_i2.p1 TRINITY_DN41748_c0_g1~~TRINITY_DN41748_c0_g1_i2.p1  ORF type:complete len:248 (-),score=39.24 TRINITY_DN41748_c0_g1_i2:596-1339(-)
MASQEPELAEAVATAARTVFDYLRLEADLAEFEEQPADALICLGSSDLRVAAHAAKLFQRGLATRLVCSGGIGTGPHSGANLLGWTRPEAEIFANVMHQEHGIPRDKILVEAESKNSGENMQFSHRLLKQHGCADPKRVILVQKPFMTRRAYATFRKQWPGSDCEAAVIATSSELCSFDEYITAMAALGIQRSDVISIMNGDLQRMTLYAKPPTEFQVPVEVPEAVASAGTTLTQAGYTANLIAVAN